MRLIHVKISGIDAKSHPQWLELYVKEAQADGREFEIKNMPDGFKPLVMAVRLINVNEEDLS